MKTLCKVEDHPQLIEYFKLADSIKESAEVEAMRLIDSGNKFLVSKLLEDSSIQGQKHWDRVKKYMVDNKICSKGYLKNSNIHYNCHDGVIENYTDYEWHCKEMIRHIVHGIKQ